MQPKISIIIPIYNTAKYLPKCLDSIINQTYQNIEIILVNDGSTDNSSKIIQEYAKKDQRIIIINQKNSGQSAARNTGLKQASGEFISFIDSDDTVDKTFIEELLSPYLQTHNISLSVCGLRYHWLKTNTAKDVFLRPLRRRYKHESKIDYTLYLLTVDGRLYSAFNKLYCKKFLKNTHFDQTLNFAEDTKFVLDYIKNTPEHSEISFVLKPLCHYNYGTETSTLKKTAVDWKNWQTSYNNLMKWVGSSPTIREKFWLFLILCRWRISYIRSKKRNKS